MLFSSIVPKPALLAVLSLLLAGDLPSATGKTFDYTLDPSQLDVTCTGNITMGAPLPTPVQTVTSGRLSMFRLLNKRQPTKPCSCDKACLLFDLPTSFGGFSIPCYWSDRPKAVFSCCTSEMRIYNGNITQPCVKN